MDSQAGSAGEPMANSGALGATDAPPAPACVHHGHADPCDRTLLTCCRCGARWVDPAHVRPWPPEDVSACGSFVRGRDANDTVKMKPAAPGRDAPYAALQRILAKQAKEGA